MVSYFVPRGRFLVKAGNIRKVLLQQQQQQQQPKHSQQNGWWPVLRHFRQLSTNTNTAKESPATPPRVMNHNSSSTLQSSQSKAKQQQQSQQKQSEQNLIQVRRNVLWRWTGILVSGICVFGAIEWQWHKRRCESNRTPTTASEFQSKVYCSLPLRIISRCWGWLAACYMPTSLRPYVYGWYSNAFKVNLEEALYPDYEHYSSLGEFFTRPLKEGVRIIDPKAPLVSPADGKVLHFGSAADTLIEQVKGVSYSIEDFLGPLETSEEEKELKASYAEALKRKRDGSTELFQCVIYLAPGDYHRFHSPTAWQPAVRRHFSGELLSVSPKVASWLPGLFCLNERVVYMGQWKHGFFSYTAVGATNVGSVEIYMDSDLKTNRWTGFNVGAHPPSTYAYEELNLLDQAENEKPTFAKGQVVGQFNMGSTIVLLFEAPKNFKFDIVAGQKIRVGESLGHILGN